MLPAEVLCPISEISESTYALTLTPAAYLEPLLEPHSSLSLAPILPHHTLIPTLSQHTSIVQNPTAYFVSKCPIQAHQVFSVIESMRTMKLVAVNMDQRNRGVSKKTKA
jgi:hypothetical protein